ncbi:MAG: trypsin-like peptidase domain-containing protein [Oscillospiraceae bacterium]|nr:trypsin-like peptidase domain-containing protein [Oscillospiraceae bacterium]
MADKKMMKRAITVLLAICIALLYATPVFGAASLSNFMEIREYNGEFADVSPDAWYYNGIRSVYERGILDGKTPGVFDPSGRLTIAETIKIAACLHKGYYTGTMDFASGSPWYSPYVEYALANGIIAGAYKDYSAAAVRSDFATIIGAAMPDEALTPINRVADGAIPDVYESYSYGLAVYRLYRAGVLTGSDAEGRFFPGRTISRAEASSIIMRIIDADVRQSVSLQGPLTAEEVYKLAAPAVFYIEIFDSSDRQLKTGSGFFISSSGLAVTNYHVVVGAYAASVTTDDGEVRDVVGIYDYDRKNDLALIQVDVENCPCLEIADLTSLLTGATVYTLGSPLGLYATFSRGIVSQASRDIDGVEFIQIDAPISSGSSGGALLDSSGRVLGVTSATAVGAQNINLAMPISMINELSFDSVVPLKSLLVEVLYYKGYFPAPDFGAFFDITVFNSGSARGGTAFSYRLSDFTGDADEVIDTYTHLVEQNQFEHTGFWSSNGVDYMMYYNSQHGVTLLMGIDVVRGRECFTITVS